MHSKINTINTIIAAVITSNICLAAAPGNVLLSVKKSKLPKESVINVSQIITIDRSFLTDKVHTLSNKVMAQVDESVKLVLKL
jgi:mRNA interferase MazF